MFITDSIFTQVCSQMSGVPMREYSKDEIAQLEEKIKAAVKESAAVMKEKGLNAFPPQKMEEMDDLLIGKTEGSWRSPNLTGGQLFNHESNFFQRTAEAYLSDSSVINNFTKTDGSGISSEISLFAYHVMDYFLPSDSKDRRSWMPIREQMRHVVQELSEQIASGGGSDLSNLKTKVTVCGVDFTAKELSQTIEALQKISDPLQKATGTVDLEQFARMGIASSQVNRYAAENLNEEQAKLITDAYDRHVKSHIKDADSYGMTLEEKMDKLGITELSPDYDPFYATSPDRKSSGTIREAAFELFSSLDVSSDAVFKQSFERALRQYAVLLQGANSHWFPTPTEYQDASAMFYRTQIQSDGTVYTRKPVNGYA